MFATWQHNLTIFVYKIKGFGLMVGLWCLTTVISWRSDLLVEKTEVPGENHRPVASHCQTLSHNVVSSTPRHERGTNSQL